MGEMAATLKSGGTEPDESEVQMILWRGEATVWVICLSIGRGRGSRDEVEEVELRREIIRSSVGESKESRNTGKVMGVGHKVGVGRAERVAESLSLNALSKRSGNCSGVVVWRGALSERPSSLAESRCMDLLSLESVWNFRVM